MPEDIESAQASSLSTSERIQLLRTIHQNHVALGGIADRKASTFIAGSLLTLAIIFVGVDRTSPTFTPIVLAAFTLAAAAFAAFAVLPRAQPEAGRSNKFNLFFFGSFAQLSEREFTTSLRDVLDKDQASLDAMMHDIYQLGTALYLRKYRFLHAAYTVFLVGLACSSLTWIIELLTAGRG
jgi:hypothetical protein